MATIGPIPINKGLVADADYWNPPSQGGALQCTGLYNTAGGVKRLDAPFFNFKPGGMSDNSGISGAFYWQDASQTGKFNSSDKMIVFTLNGDAYSAEFGFTSATWTNITNSMNIPPSGVYTFDVLNNIAIFASNGFPEVSTTYPPVKLTAYNGSLALLGGSPPPGGIIKCVNGYAFLTNDTTSTGTLSRVYWSNPNDPETWNAANYVDFRKNDGEIITALSMINNCLVIFKPNSIGVLQTTSITIGGVTTLGPLTQITDRLGCIGPLAVDTLPDGTLVFIGSDGHVYRFDGYGFEDLSHQPWPQSNLNYQPTNQNSISFNFLPYGNSVLKVDPANHRLFILNNGANHNTDIQLLLCYDYLNKTWSDWSPLVNETTLGSVIYMNVLPASENSTGSGWLSKRIYFGTSTGKIYNVDSTSQLTDASQLTLTYETSINLGNIVPPQFIPRTVLIPIVLFGNTYGTISVYVGFDGTYQSTPQINGKAMNTITAGRLVVPVNFKMNTLAQSPLTMQLKIVVTGTLIVNYAIDPFTINPIFISDEVLN